MLETITTKTHTLAMAALDVYIAAYKRLLEPLPLLWQCIMMFAPFLLCQIFLPHWAAAAIMLVLAAPILYLVAIVAWHLFTGEL
jgi:hypothetical protein